MNPLVSWTVADIADGEIVCLLSHKIAYKKSATFDGLAEPNFFDDSQLPSHAFLT